MSNLPFEVSIDFPLYQSRKGLYFIGQTPILNGQSGTAFASLCNPHGSHSLVYVNAITITNLSESSLLAEFSLGHLLHHYSISNLVMATNTSICPPMLPNANIEYLTTPLPTPMDGVPIFNRIVPPQSTLVVDGGQIILGQMQSLGVSINNLNSASFKGVRFAFGWSEEDIC